MKLRILSFTIYLFLFLSFTTYKNLQAQDSGQKSIAWNEIEEAVKLNTENPRDFLIYVYSDNCGWCRKMENETFASNAIIDFINQNFYAVKINSNIKRDIQYNKRKFSYVSADPATGNPAHHEFLLVLLQGRMAYPSIVCLDENLVYIGVERGFKSIEPFRKYLSYIKEDIYLSGQSFDQYYNQK
jgi:thioredoxin-related protein